MSRRFALQAAMGYAGFFSIVAQLLLMRELIIAYSDYELFIGIILGWWLALIGLFSVLAGKLADRFSIGPRGLSISFLVFPFVLILQITCIRYLQFLYVGEKEFIGFWGVVFYTLLILIPSSAVIGFQFPVASRLYVKMSAGSPSGGGRIYAVESFGSILGGVLYGLLFLAFSKPLLTAFILGAGSFLVVVLLEAENRQSLSKPVPLLGLILFVLYFGALTTGAASFYEEKTEYLRWSKSGHLIYSKDSKYGEIEVLEEKPAGSRSFLINNTGMFTLLGDQIHNEEVAHLPLLCHERPRVVALIGGGIGGALKEILKHPVERVYYVEINPSVIEAARMFFSDQLEGPLEDPRVKVVNMDGRYFLKKPPELLDVVMLDFQDPYALQRVRFYSIDFFLEAKRALSDKGVILVQGYNTTDRNYLDGKVKYEAYPTAKSLNTCIYKGMKDVFPRVEMIPGSWDYFLASSEAQAQNNLLAVLTERLQARKIASRFITPRYLQEIFQEPNLLHHGRYLEKTEAKISTDAWPIVFVYDLYLWAGTGYPEIKSLLKAVPDFSVKHSAVILSLAFFPLILRRGRDKMNPLTFFLLIGSTGFAAMTVEILAIYQLSSLYGYFYPLIGLIFAVFLGGILVGNLVAETSIRKKCSSYRYILGAELLLLAVIFAVGSPEGLREFSDPVIITVLFTVVLLAGGCLGLEFSLCFHMANVSGKAWASLAGMLYGADVIGGSLGAFLCTSILLPVLGIPTLCVKLLIVKTAVFLLCFIQLRPGTQPAVSQK